MTEVKMKRIGLRLVVLSVVSLIIFLSIRRQYNTAQNLLQRKVAQISHDSQRTEHESLYQIEQRVASVHNVPELDSDGNNGDGGESVVNIEENDEMFERADRHEKEDVEDSDSDGIDYGPVSEEPETLLDSFLEMFKLKSGDTSIVKENKEADNETASVEDSFNNVDRGEKKVTFELLESELEHLETSKNESDEDNFIENGDERLIVEVNATVSSEEEVTTYTYNNDAAETDSELTKAEDDADDLIKEYDEYPEKDKENVHSVTTMAGNITQLEVLSNLSQNLRQEMYSENSLNSIYRTTAPMRYLTTVGAEKEVKSVIQEGNVGQRDQLESLLFDQRPQPMVQTATGQQDERLRLLRESLTPQLLMSILGDRLSPRMASYLKYKILRNLEGGTTSVTRETPVPTNGLPDNEPASLLQPSLTADNIKADINNGGHMTSEDNIFGADNDTDNDNNTLSNDDISSVYSNQPTISNVETTTSRVVYYNNPRPLSDVDFSILRTSSYVPKRLLEKTFTSPPSDSVQVRDEFKTNSHAQYLSAQVEMYSTTIGNHKLNSDLLEPPSWLKSNFPNETPPPALNEPFLIGENSNNRDKIVFHPEHSPNYLQNTVHRIQPNIYDTPQNSPMENYASDQEHFSEGRILNGHQQFVYEQEIDQSKPGDGKLLQEFNAPDRPGQSYSDVLMQQKILIKPPVEEMTNEQSLNHVESISEVKVAGCPREVKLSETPHPLTALVAFPGDDTDWIRNILEQLFGETTESVYQVTADLSGGSPNRLHQMDRNILVQTNSLLDNNFEKVLVVLRNPYSVEERHRMFRPSSIDWQKQYLWGDTYVSWLSSGLPTYVVVYEDLVENPLTELIKLTDFLRTNGQLLNYKCAMSVAETPPKLVSDLKQITGIYYKERQKINQNIDKVIQVAKTKYPLLLDRLESYKVQF